MSFEEKFSQQITNFQRYGSYSYEYDSAGNCIFNSSSNDFSQVFLAFPLPNYSYDNSKILSFYDPTFTEFIPQATSDVVTPEAISQMQKDLEAEKAQTSELTKQLDSLIAVNESTPSLADKQAAKQVILELRKAMGQGRVDSDFSSDFPYAPVKKETSMVEGTAAIAPSVSEPVAIPAESEVNTDNTARAAVQGSNIGIGKGPLIYTTSTKT